MSKKQEMSKEEQEAFLTMMKSLTHKSIVGSVIEAIIKFLANALVFIGLVTAIGWLIKAFIMLW